MILPSGAAMPSATSIDKINGTQSLQHMFSAYKLSVYALQWLLPNTAQDSIIDVLGQHPRCNHSQLPVILHFVAHRGFLRSRAANCWPYYFSAFSIRNDKLDFLTGTVTLYFAVRSVTSLKNQSPAKGETVIFVRKSVTSQ